MSVLIDLTGQRFGRLTVIERGIPAKGSTNATWLCKCDCGNEVVVRSTTLRKGKSISCGCYRSEYWRKKMTKHGKCYEKIGHIWYSMKARCFCATNQAYENYGGRGITVCEQWVDDFEEFYGFVSVLPHFGEDGYSLDRIDNDGDYAPGNVRWATRKEQANNRRKRRWHKRPQET